MFAELVERALQNFFCSHKCRKSPEFGSNTKVVTPNVTWSLTLCNQLGGGFKYFLRSSLPGEMIQFDEHILYIFQVGWFNHQLVNRWKCFCSPQKISKSQHLPGMGQKPAHLGKVTGWYHPGRYHSVQCSGEWMSRGWDGMMACFSQKAENTNKNLRANNRTPKMIQYVDIWWYSLCRLSFLMFPFPKNQGPNVV